jgi:hypothetical protein
MDMLSRHFDRLLAAIFIGGFALFVASAFVGAGGDLIAGDAVEYFEYARSVNVLGRLPETHIKYPCGVALIGSVTYLPMVLVGKALVGAGVVEASSRWATGWALPQQIAFCLPFFILAWIACRANASMLVRLGYPARVVRPMILFWIVSTNVGFYMLKEPAMSESATYALLSLYYWALVTWVYRPANSAPVPGATDAWFLRAVLIGLVLGLAGTVRQQNILHCVALPLLLVAERRRGPGGVPALRTLATVALVSAALFVIPWIAWYMIDGKVQLFSYGDEHFNFLSPRPLDSLFHPGHNGLFVWHPAFALAAAGIFLFVRRHRALAATWVVPMAMQFYLVASWYWLSFGTSIGHRGFFPLFPLLVAGWVAAGDYAVTRGWTRALLTSLVLLTLANGVVTAMLLTRELDPLGLPPGP